MENVMSYDLGTHCWFPDDKLGWIGASVTSIKQKKNNKYILELYHDTDDSTDVHS